MPGHEVLRGADVGDEVADAVEQAVAIAEANIWYGEARQLLFALGGIGLRHASNHASTVSAAVACTSRHDVPEDRQLKAPALHVLVARGLVGELVRTDAAAC